MKKTTNKPKGYYQPTDLAATTKDEAIALQPQTNADEVNTEPSSESAQQDLSAEIKATFAKVRSNYDAIVQKIQGGVLPSVEEARPLIEWYQKYIYKPWDVAYHIAALKRCTQGNQWSAFFWKTNGLASMQNTIRKYIDNDGKKE